MDEITQRLQKVFRKVFDDDDLVLSEETTSAQIDGWDSIAHMNLIIAVEKEFGVRFAAPELAALKDSAVGEMIKLVSSKQGGAAP
jgi:acyl carrier protein